MCGQTKEVFSLHGYDIKIVKEELYIIIRLTSS